MRRPGRDLPQTTWVVTSGATIRRYGNEDACILEKMSDLRTTANLHDSTKKPNFLLIVVLSSVFLLLFFVVAYVFLRKDVKGIDPHRPNPTPNSMLTTPGRLPASVLAA